MDRNHFDELARSMASETGARRAALRLLAGGALGMLAARFSFDEDAEAKPKRKSRPAKQKEKMQSEGKRKGKKPGKKKPKPKPQECYSDAACGACERCIGGRCLELIPPCDANDCREAFCNPATNSWECRGSCQSQEAVCCQGVCYAPCSGGRPLDPETCQCGCLPEEWQCADKSCVATGQCCDGERRCPGGVCVSEGTCCPVWCPAGMISNPANNCNCECPPGSDDTCGIFCCPGGLGCTIDWRGFSWCVDGAGNRSCPLGWVAYGQNNDYCAPGGS